MHKPIFILFILLPMLFSSACGGDELDLNIKPFGPSLTGKLNTISWAFQGAAVQDISLTYDKDAKLSGYTLSQNGIKASLVATTDTSGKVLKLVNTSTKDTLTYSYTTAGNLKEIKNTNKSLETFEYNNTGQLVYYTKSSTKTGTKVFEEVRIYKWLNGNVISQTLSKPGKSIEQEDFEFGSEPNLVLEVLAKQFKPMVLLEPYLISKNLPTKSSKIYEGLLLKFSNKKDSNNKVTEFMSETYTLTEQKEYEKITFSYHK